MENTKTIKVGNWTVEESALQNMTLDEAKTKFNYLDLRVVEQGYKMANPKRKAAKKKTPKSED